MNNNYLYLNFTSNNLTSVFQGLLNQHILNNISQINTLPSSSTVTLANGTTIPSSLYSGPGSTLPTSNIPLELSSTNSFDPTINSQQSPLLSRIISDNDRSPNPPTSLMTNGSSDGHSLLDNNTFPNLPTLNSGMSTSFLSNTNLTDLSSPNSGVIGQLPDHHSFRYLLPTSNSQSIQTNRVPLTQAETRMLNRLNSAYAKLPSLLESERQRYLIFFSIKKKLILYFCSSRTNANRIYGRNPLGNSQIISYYPQTPPAGSDTPEFYYRLAPDTLFFVFYYMEVKKTPSNQSN